MNRHTPHRTVGPKVFVPVFIGCAIALTHVSSAQPIPEHSTAGPRSDLLFGGVLFAYDLFNFASSEPELSRLDVYISFVNDVLQFVKEDEGLFRASYELNVLVLDRKKNHVADQSANGEIVVANFVETNSLSTFTRKHLQFDLEPGKYQVVIRLTDLDTRKSLERKKDIELREFTPEKVHLSDVIFTDELGEEPAESQNLVPNLLRTFDRPESQFKVYYEIYAPTGADSIEVRHEVVDAQSRSVFSEIKRIGADSPVIPQVVPLREIVESPGRYQLVVQVKNGKSKATMRSRFFVQWSTLSFVDSSLDLVVEQLRYIAKGKDIEAMLAATESEREMLLEEFWRRRDPTPETDSNELKDEFFRRVDFANRHFTVLMTDQDGWQTDRGRIYIKYGPPSDVEREPTQLNDPAYEIWFYRKLNMRFVFADRYGNGDYQLIRSE